jgi:hypothetical protein
LLKRQWRNNSDNFVNFVLLNPSTADKKKDDPTIRACIKFANNLGYNGLYVTNLFAYRTCDTEELKKALEPIGEKNDYHIKKWANKSRHIIVAWGNNGTYMNRDKELLKMLKKEKNIKCLKITKLGNPGHPLFIRRKTKPIDFIRTE